MIEYEKFLKDFDNKIQSYFSAHRDFVFCKAGCASCCKKGEYPLSELELKFLMRGYIGLDNNIKKFVQKNIKQMEKGGKCPFLIDDKCSVYMYRPIICRVHGIAYLCKENTVKIPFCVNENKNYSKVYKNGMIDINPVLENLDTPSVLKNFNYGDIKNLYDWLDHSPT